MGTPVDWGLSMNRAGNTVLGRGQRVAGLRWRANNSKRAKCDHQRSGGAERVALTQCFSWNWI